MEASGISKSQMELPRVNHGWKRKHPGFPSGVANRDLGPIQEFHGSHGSPNGDCRSIRNPQIGSVELSWRKLLQKPRLALLQSGNF